MFLRRKRMYVFIEVILITKKLYLEKAFEEAEFVLLSSAPDLEMRY